MSSTRETLSVIIPCYNERATIEDLVQAVESVQLDTADKEIVLIDDGSTDGTRELLAVWADRYTVCFHDRNRGKGAAVRTGMANARGTIYIIQDADLEYDPNDFPALLQPIYNGESDIVYGYRAYSSPETSERFYYAGGTAMTRICQLLYDTHLRDVPVCYKVFRPHVIEQITLSEDGFSFCPELTTQFLNANRYIAQVPISYRPRSLAEGKKLKYRDGIRYVYVLCKYRAIKAYHDVLQRLQND